MAVTEAGIHLEVLARWSKYRGPGRVEVLWAGSMGPDIVAVCQPVPAGVLRAWLDAGPYPWREVCAKLAPLAEAMAAAHAANVDGFSFDADDLWLGLDGRALLTLPRPSGSPAQDRENLRALASAALGPNASLPTRMRRDRPHDPSPSQALAAGFSRPRWRVSRWVVAAVGAAAAASLVGAALYAPASATYDDAGLHQARSTGDSWTRTASRVDAGDRDAWALVDAFEHGGGEDPRVRAQAALLRVRLAEDGAARDIAVQQAVVAAARTKAPGVRFSAALVQAEEALGRGALLEAQVHLVRARRWTDHVQDAARRRLQRLLWTVENASRASPVRPHEVTQASERLVSPSLERVALRSLLVAVWAARDDRAMALSQLNAVMGVPRARLPRLQFEFSVARAHLAMQLGRLDDASMALDRANVHCTTGAERASLRLARASLARVRGDRASANPALDGAAEELHGLEGHGLSIDLLFERAAWSLHAGAVDDARVQLDAALALHDTLRGLGARSRLPLERAYRRALQGDTRLMSEAPPSRASASP